jgi:hypothetical protein
MSSKFIPFEREKAESAPGRRRASASKTKDSAKQLPQPPTLDKLAADIRAYAKKTFEDIVAIGRLLTEAKKQAGHGNWLSWLDKEFGWSAETAANFTRVYARRAIFQKIRNMARCTPTVLYALAKAPGEVLDQLLERVERGEVVSLNDVKFLTVEVRSRNDPIKAPYYMTSEQDEEPEQPEPEPPPIAEKRAPTRAEQLAAIGREAQEARLGEGRFTAQEAGRLIDALVQMDPYVRAKAVELLRGKRSAELDRFAEAVRELAAALDRSREADGAPRARPSLRVVEGEEQR